MDIRSKFETHAPPSSRTLRTQLNLWLSGFYQWLPLSFLRWSSDFCVLACFQDPLPWGSSPLLEHEEGGGSLSVTLSWIQDFISTHLQAHLDYSTESMQKWIITETQLNQLTNPASSCSQSLLSTSFFLCMGPGFHHQEGSSHSFLESVLSSHLTQDSPLIFLIQGSWPPPGELLLLCRNNCSYPVSLHPLLSRQNNASYGCQVNLPKAQVWSHHSLALKSSVAP